MTTAVIDACIDDYRESLEEDRRVLLDRYEIVDVALKVVGVGSVGLGAFVALFDGGSRRRPALPPGQAGRGVRLRAVPRAERASRRTARGSSPASDGSRRRRDVLLGWPSADRWAASWYVRQLQDQKASAVVEAMTDGRPRDVGRAVRRGRSLAATPGPVNPATIAGYLGDDEAFDHAIGEFAEAYADQTERDFATFSAAIKDGRIKAEPGV